MHTWVVGRRTVGGAAVGAPRATRAIYFALTSTYFMSACRPIAIGRAPGPGALGAPVGACGAGPLIDALLAVAILALALALAPQGAPSANQGAKRELCPSDPRATTQKAQSALALALAPSRLMLLVPLSSSQARSKAPHMHIFARRRARKTRKRHTRHCRTTQGSDEDTHGTKKHL